MKKFNKDTFRIACAEFNIRKSLIALAISCAVLAFIVILKLTTGKPENWYGVLIGVGFLLALAFAIKYCRYRDLDSDLPYDLIWWIFPMSLLGARLMHCIVYGQMQDFFNFNVGGFVFYGGAIGGVIGLVICCLIKKVNIIKTMDIAAPVLLLGQAFGRIGCYSAECCYGLEVTSKALQWFPISVYVGEANAYCLATFFWESMLCLIGFFVLAKLLQKFRHTGLIACSYLFYYGIVRYFTESFRHADAQATVSGLPISKIISLIIVLVGTIGIVTIVLRERRKNFEENDKTSNN